MTERKPNVSVSIVLPLFLDIKFGHGDIHEWSGPRLTSYNAYCWHSVQNQMKTCLFAVQSQSGYTHTNNVLCLCPSPQASKLCVWCGAQGKWSHHVSKTNRRGRNRALCIGKQSWMMNHSWLHALLNEQHHGHSWENINEFSCLSYITDHMISIRTAWLVTNGDCKSNER